MSQTFAVVLAAGKGTRMKSKRHKVLHPVCGKPMVEHVLQAIAPLGCQDTIVVTGYGADDVQSALGDRYTYVTQEEQLGTGHAVMMAESLLEGRQGQTLVLFGDTPLITTETLQALLASHRKSGAAVTILTTVLDDPYGYGRVLRDEDGNVLRIIEQKDASVAERQIREVNTGFFCFDNELLLQSLARIDNNNEQQEYYLPDCIGVLVSMGHAVHAHVTGDTDETLGVNDRVALAQAEKRMRRRINAFWMRRGVTIIDPDQTYIEPDVTLGADTVLEPGTMIKGQTQIGENCTIGPYTEIERSEVGQGCTIRHSTVTDSRLEDGVEVGPYAHIRPGNRIGPQCRIGSFVELKNSVLQQASKVPHLSYIGDADIGTGVNVGCGSITVNYDGFRKQRTIIEDGAFIGCNTNLIAPVKVGKHAYVAAGSTITDEVPGESLAIARQRQTNKAHYVRKLQQKLNETEGER